MAKFIVEKDSSIIAVLESGKTINKRLSQCTKKELKELFFKGVKGIKKEGEAEQDKRDNERGTPPPEKPIELDAEKENKKEGQNDSSDLENGETE